MENVTRRGFMGIGAVATTAIAAAGCFGRPARADEVAGIEWDAEYDVLVIGLGAAGATAAISASRAGASVLVVDKAPRAHVGGNSAVCMQYIACTDNVEGARTYLDALRNGFETPSDAILDAYAELVAGNMDFMVGLGAPNPTILSVPDYPEFDGSADLPYFTVDGIGGNSAGYKLLLNACGTDENIDIWYEAPAVNLIQEADTKVVLGAEVFVDDRYVNVRAKNGVVLACGGYEYDAQMLQDYCMEKKCYALGMCTYNTGDGVRMAARVGANLWHMAHIVRHVDFVDEQSGYAPFRLAPKVANDGAIFVGGDATRFMNETYAYRHGKYPFHGSFHDLMHPETMWMVFDNKVFSKGPLFSTFSVDNSAEIEKGWIAVGDSLEDLAGKIGLAPDALASTVAEYNGLCEQGEDIYFGRSESYLFPLDEAPFYAMPLFESLVNTQGGPERNERGEILTVDGEVIPHLYGCGELGDIWSCFYQGGNNFGGGIAWGRAVGANAAAVKDDVDQESQMGDRENYVPENAGEEVYVDLGENQYEGQGVGKSLSPIVVRVTYADGVIENVEVVSHAETEGIGTMAIDELPSAIVAANSTDVDVVAGATMTSNGIIEAVNDAIAQAGAVIVDERPEGNVE